jgi:hypothetical protein
LWQYIVLWRALKARRFAQRGKEKKAQYNSKKANGAWEDFPSFLNEAMKLLDEIDPVKAEGGQ